MVKVKDLLSVKDMMIQNSNEIMRSLIAHLFFVKLLELYIPKQLVLIQYSVWALDS